MGRALRAPNSVGRSRSIEAATKKVEIRDPAHAMWAVETTLLSPASYATRGRPKDGGAAPPGALELSAPNLGFGWRPNFNCWIYCYERVQFSTQKKANECGTGGFCGLVFACFLSFWFGGFSVCASAALLVAPCGRRRRPLSLLLPFFLLVKSSSLSSLLLYIHKGGTSPTSYDY